MGRKAASLLRMLLLPLAVYTSGPPVDDSGRSMFRWRSCAETCCSEQAHMLARTGVPHRTPLRGGGGGIHDTNAANLARTNLEIR